MSYLLPSAIIGALNRAAGAVMHHVRDVTLAEDAFRSDSQALHRLMSSLRTLTINLLKREKVKNMAAQIEGFIDSFDTLIQFMTQQLVL
ncbi:MAG: hypothetical protein LH609_16245 [Rudanella sp.]|nr:hypothetical protein [Rudanella sp.]